jgi:apolipoprotein N-acyltransferase
MTFYTTHLKSFSNPAMALLSGLLLFLSFPKFGNGILAWVALLPLFHALRDAKPKEGFKIGFLTGLIAHVGILYWISHVVVQYGYLPVYAGIAAMLLLAAYLSLYTAFFAMGVVFLRARGNAVYLTAPLLWTLLEFARSHFLTGFPWENLAYSQYLFGNIIQIADITGIYGITFTIVLINAVLYNALTAQFRGGRYPAVEIATACAVLAVIYGYGHFRTADIQESLKNASASFRGISIRTSNGTHATSRKRWIFTVHFRCVPSRRRADSSSGRKRRHLSTLNAPIRCGRLWFIWPGYPVGRFSSAALVMKRRADGFLL